MAILSSSPRSEEFPTVKSPSTIKLPVTVSPVLETFPAIAVEFVPIFVVFVLTLVALASLIHHFLALSIIFILIFLSVYILGRSA